MLSLYRALRQASHTVGVHLILRAKIFQCKVENFKKSKKIWQGPRAPEGASREGEARIISIVFYFQLCIERSFDTTTPKVPKQYTFKPDCLL